MKKDKTLQAYGYLSKLAGMYTILEIILGQEKTKQLDKFIH